MSDIPAPLGRISWGDLNVPDAKPPRDFHTRMAGWTATPRSIIERPVGAVGALVETA